MDLAKTLQDMTSMAVELTGTLRTSINYFSVEEPIRDTSTREVQEVSKPYKITNALFVDYEIKHVDGNVVRKGDVQIIIPSKNLPVTPVEEKDYVEEVKTGVIWNIIKKNIDPAKAAWVLQARRK